MTFEEILDQAVAMLQRRWGMPQKPLASVMRLTLASPSPINEAYCHAKRIRHRFLKRRK